MPRRVILLPIHFLFSFISLQNLTSRNFCRRLSLFSIRKSFISILDDHDTIIRKFRSAVTDSEAKVMFKEGKDGINNLMTIYSVVTGKTYEQIEDEFTGKGYGDFKLAVGEAVSEELRPVRENFARLMNDKAYLEETYKAGAEIAQRISDRTLTKVKKKVGLLANPFK